MKYWFFLVLALFAGALPVGAASVLDGVWQTEGYGYVLRIKGTDVTLYEKTGISCLESGLSAGPLKREVAAPAVAAFPVAIPGFIDADMQIIKGRDKRTISLHRTDTNTFMTARRIDALPENCGPAGEGTAEESVQVFHQTFKDHYPFLGQGHEMWGKARYQGNDDHALFEHLTGLLAVFQDPHTALIAPSIDAMYFGSESGGRSVPEENRLQGFRIVEENYLKVPLEYYGSQRIAFGSFGDGVGYLRLSAFTEYAAMSSFEADLAELERALGRILAPRNGLRALVIDLRDNFGGSDKLALEVARRLTSESYVAYAKQALITDHEDYDWTAPNETLVEPTAKPFTGQVILLTGPDTLSAGETFTMAMMARTPAVTRIGDHTRGAFSDMLPRILPNGWLFALPNERYLDEDGKSYDRTGIPPHISAPVFAKADLDAGRDSAIEAALSELGLTALSR